MTGDPSHITDHGFLPQRGAPWWERCHCGISEAGHRDRSTLAPPVLLAPPASHRCDGVASVDCPACFTESRAA